MSSIPSNLYAEWRTRSPLASALREESETSQPNEHLLQLIWQHQRIRREPLRTLEGRAVRILHPGFWNHEAGPDFRQAIVQFDANAPTSGDIEIDLHSHGWRGHAHDSNPNYEKVILHVVWEAEAKGQTPLPTLVMEKALDAPLSELRRWLGSEAAKDVPEPLIGQCRGPLRELSATTWSEILQQAAQIRLQSKAMQFQARARQIGWEQALWEGLFSALGYKHNVWPMRRLGELIPLICGKSSANFTTFEWQARLLGLSGLLPADLPRGQKSDDYFRQLWDCWWREREALHEFILPRGIWHLSGLRPANHPQRRLALAAHWLSRRDCLGNLAQWLTASVADAELTTTLLKVFRPERDNFWEWHWTFSSKRTKTPQPLLGPPRVTDLAMNVVLPWFWARAVAGKGHRLQQTAEHRYFAWPKAEDNAVFRLARQRLFGAANIRELNTAAAQQGLLQIVRDFCDHSNALCENCPFPEMVGNLKEGMARKDLNRPR